MLNYPIIIENIHLATIERCITIHGEALQIYIRFDDGELIRVIDVGHYTYQYFAFGYDIEITRYQEDKDSVTFSCKSDNSKEFKIKIYKRGSEATHGTSMERINM